MANAADLLNVTVTRNMAGRAGAGGVAMDGSIRNSILWGNFGGQPRDLTTTYGVDLDHSDLHEQSGPVNDLGGNINMSPLFVAADWHLRATSPCIDTGTCAGAPTTDIDGDPRPTGAGCDIGADEFVP